MARELDSRTPAQMGWLVGAAGLVVVLLAGGGWLAVRGLATARPATFAAATGDATDDTGTDTAAPPGASSVVAGVPWGFAVSRQGAAAAALTAVAVTGQPEAVFDPDRFRRVAEVVFAPSQVEVQVSQVEVARVELETSDWGRQPVSRRMYHFAPLAASVTGFDQQAGTARVQVWSMTLVGVGDAGGAVFTTSTVDLGLDPDGDWQVMEVESVEGPTPLVQATATAPGRTRALLRDAVATLPLPAGAP